jgi:hypothetical protein
VELRNRKLQGHLSVHSRSKWKTLTCAMYDNRHIKTRG